MLTDRYQCSLVPRRWQKKGAPGNSLAFKLLLPLPRIWQHQSDLNTQSCDFVALARIALQYRSSFQRSNLIGRTVTRSQTSLGVKARFRLGFRAGYDVF